MNKKADIEISLKTLIGFILVAIIFFAFVGFFVKLWGVFLNKPNQATLNSFSNLMAEIESMKEYDEKTVPFFIQDGLYLYTNCEHTYNEYGLKGETVENDICICGKTCYDKRHKREVITWLTKGQKVDLTGDNYITYNKDQKVRNIKIKRTPQGASLLDCAKGGC